MALKRLATTAMLYGVARFGANVRALRERAKLTQSDLADLLRVKQPAVWKWENDKSGLPSTPTLFRLANALNCTLEDLLDGVDADYSKRARDEDRRWNELMLAWARGEKPPVNLDELQETVRRLSKTARRAEVLGRVFERVDDTDTENDAPKYRKFTDEERMLLELWRPLSVRAKDSIRSLLIDLQPKHVKAKHKKTA